MSGCQGGSAAGDTAAACAWCSRHLVPHLAYLPPCTGIHLAFNTVGGGGLGHADLSGD